MARRFWSRGRVRRMAWAAVMALLCALACSGCIAFRPLQLPQLQEFQESVRKEYPRADVSCHYEYGAGVSIRASNTVVDEEFAYTVLGILQPIVRDEAFIQDLFALFEEEASGDHNWELGRRPDIQLRIEVGGSSVYQFSARATKEGYNSGYDPDSYTWDGYATWYGTKFVDHVPHEITPEEIEKAIAAYS